jgi:hypothetical protein
MRSSIVTSSLACLVSLSLAACETQGGPSDDEGAGGGTPIEDVVGAVSTGSGSAGSGSSGGGSGGADSGSTGSGSAVVLEPCAPFAHEVVDVSYGPDAGWGQEAMPGIVLGPPRGAGLVSGSLDVVALGNGGSITLGFGALTIVDGEGADFIVFENPFYAGGDPAHPFAELATVEVSADGETWHAFDCSATSYPYGSCAGWNPVLANVDDNELDPTDPLVAGGEAFDLADLGVVEARFVRIVDRPDTVGLAGSFDLDAVALVHASCSAGG